MGTNVDGRKKGKLIFPFQADLTLRTAESVVQDAQTRSNGVRGPAPLRHLQEDVTHTVPDLLHCFDKGGPVDLLVLMVDEGLRHMDFSVFESIADINSVLSAIRPPPGCSRPLKDITDVRRAKAKTIRFFLMAAWPVLRVYLPPRFWQSWEHLLRGVRELLRPVVTDVNIISSRELLKKWQVSLGGLWGREELKIKAHLLLHLPDVTQWAGPPNLFSLYKAESTGFQIVKVATSATNIAQQLATRISQKTALNATVERVGSETGQLLWDERTQRRHRKKMGGVGTEALHLKSPSAMTDAAPTCAALRRQLDEGARILAFSRLRWSRTDGLLELESSSYRSAVLYDSPARFVAVFHHGKIMVVEICRFLE